MGTDQSRAGVILAMEDVRVRDENHLINTICALTPGQRVKMTVWRDRKSQAVEVTIGEPAGQKSRAGKP